MTFFFVLLLLSSFYLLFGLFCFLCSPSLVNVTGFYTEDEPICLHSRKLGSSIFNESVLLPGYSSPLRKDRIGKLGGGVALYVRDNIVVKRRVDLEPSNQLELLWA